MQSLDILYWGQAPVTGEGSEGEGSSPPLFARPCSWGFAGSDGLRFTS